MKKEGTASEGLPEVHAILKDIRAYLDRNLTKGLSMRPAALLGRNRKKILRAFELLFSAPGSPIIYPTPRRKSRL